MKTLAQHLAALPPLVVEAIARSQGLTPPPTQSAVDWLAAALLEPEQVQAMWRQLRPEEQAALQQLAAEGNLMAAASFQRRWGEVRRLGGGSLQRLRPWQQPATIAESLWYRGWIGRGFAETPAGLVDCFAIPTDLLPLLPLPAPAAAFPLAPAALPDGRGRSDGDAFLDDLATLLIHLHNQTVWAGDTGRWRGKDLAVVIPQWRTPPADPNRPLAAGSRGALLFHCLDRLGFVQAQGRRQRLNREVVRDWLEEDRCEQRCSLFAAWRTSPDWNDLCLTPGLRCIEGNWRNDPVHTRAALFAHLRLAPAQVWYGLDDFITALHSYAPDFQRPDGNYDAWYVRDQAGVHLRGFEHWQEVEGRLLRYLWQGPLFWLGVTALEAGGAHWQLTPDGAAWLAEDGTAARPAAPPPPSLVVGEDFRIHLPSGARLSDRFRVARFGEWEATWLGGYRYRISRRGLRHAAAAGIGPDQVLAFLERASQGALPANVRRAVAAFQL